ncbi:hypothetical protein [Uliginosibacterium sp. H1]|uniref:hypothetical protein n=1 Tax=Uliginosibacterium sp. H1 TaxID=3114757 RepID=UPI002E172D87|nr:hypothetical protein [Uliginosibacterium sp. H1]
MTTPLNEDQQKTLRSYAWGHFVQHAEQRLKTFNFYVVFCTVLIGAFSTLASKDGISANFVLLPLLLSVLSFVFWKLDERTKMLIAVSSDALRYLDRLALADAPPEAQVLGLFAMDDSNTSRQSKYPLLSGHFNYSRVFNWVFGLMGLVGLAGTLACLLLPQA